MTRETTRSENDHPDEYAVAWRLVTDLFNRPTWPTAMWDGSPANAARQLSEFGDAVVALVKPVRESAPCLVDQAVQLARSATVCASLMGDHDTEKVCTADRARALCDALAPFTAVANRALNDLADHYGFRVILTPTPAQRRSLPPGHEEFAPNALIDGIQVVVYWSNNRCATHRSR